MFKNESSQGFRRWNLRIEEKDEPMKVETVEDYALLRPFEGAVNWPTLLLIRRNGEATNYPVRYRRFIKTVKNVAPDLSIFEDLQAMPVPGTDAGPWLVGTEKKYKHGLRCLMLRGIPSIVQERALQLMLTVFSL